jgi:hypothetical protein
MRSDVNSRDPGSARDMVCAFGNDVDGVRRG